MDFRKLCIVEPGSKPRLAKVDPNFAGHEIAEADGRALTKDNVARMAKLQARLYAEGRQSLLIVLQAPDAGGKDGVVRSLFSGMNPQGVKVTPFKQPTPAEAAHDFLWRAHAPAPAKGEVAIFNRSHYESVLIVRVRKLVPRKVWSQHYERIADFEKLLEQGGTRILKFFLHIDADEQLRRFKQRLDDPDRNWKISDSDYTERALWDKYRKAYDDMLALTSARRAPWHVIPANHNWFRNLAVSSIVTQAMEEMDFKLPAPKVDLDAIRAKYHAAAQGEA